MPFNMHSPTNSSLVVPYDFIRFSDSLVYILSTCVHFRFPFVFLVLNYLTKHLHYVPKVYSVVYYSNHNTDGCGIGWFVFRVLETWNWKNFISKTLLCTYTKLYISLLIAFHKPQPSNFSLIINPYYTNIYLK